MQDGNDGDNTSILILVRDLGFEGWTWLISSLRLYAQTPFLKAGLASGRRKRLTQNSGSGEVTRLGSHLRLSAPALGLSKVQEKCFSANMAGALRSPGSSACWCPGQIPHVHPALWASGDSNGCSAPNTGKSLTFNQGSKSLR